MSQRMFSTVGIALALGTGVGPAAAQDATRTVCVAALAGTYLTTITNGKGEHASRSLVTLHGDGTVSAVDSRQYHGVMGAAFSAQKGGYRCQGVDKATARTLNFGFPKRASIARSDWAIEKNRATGAISGTITLTVYMGVEGVDPFSAKGGKRIDTFRFTSAPVAPPAK